MPVTPDPALVKLGHKVASMDEFAKTDVVKFVGAAA